MNPSRWGWDFLSAVEFETRVPVPTRGIGENSLAGALKFFPLVGLLVGASAATLFRMLNPHLPAMADAAIVLVYLVCITGCLHEDGLADAADGFGGGWNREQILMILRDSRIGSYGAAALVLSLMLRWILLSSLGRGDVFPILISAQVLCRWTTLPLGYWLAPARANVGGQGVRVAGLVGGPTLVGGTVFSFAVVILLLRWHAAGAILAAISIAGLSGIYYRRRIGGVTGDCFGATNQLTEMAVYLCGVWT